MRFAANLCLKNLVFIGKKDSQCMKNRTLKVIIILVGSLFLNIEAAHAGLVHKFKVYIHQEFPGYQFVYILGALVALAFFLYIVFTPAFKDKGRFAGSGYYPQPTYHSKRLRVKKIADILRAPQSL